MTSSGADKFGLLTKSKCMSSMGQGNLTPYGIKIRQTRESTLANEINHGLLQRVISSWLTI